MGVVSLTFDGRTNTARMDAFMGAYLTNYQNGIVKGLGDELDYTFSNGRITFKSGYVSVYGRRAYVEEGTYVDISLDSNKYGFVLLNIDTENNLAYISVREETGRVPTLRQLNLLEFEGIYELVICAYVKTTSSIATNPNYEREYVYPLTKKVEDTKTEIINNFTKKKIRYTSKSSSSYTYDLTDIETNDALVVIPINKSIYVMIPGDLLKVSKSVNSIQYQYLTKSFSLKHEMSTDRKLKLTPGATDHRIEYIYIYY